MTAARGSDRRATKLRCVVRPGLALLSLACPALAAGALAAGVVQAPGVSFGGDVSANTSTAAGSTVAQTQATRAFRMPYAEDFGATASGTTDDTAAIQAGLNALAAAGGGHLWMSPKQYLVGTTASLSVPSNVALYCPKPLSGNANPTPWLTAPYTFRVGPYPVLFQAGSGTRGCNYLSSAMAGKNFAFSNSMRDEINIQTAFTGTGLQVVGTDVQMQDTFVGGFALGIDGESARLHLTNVNVDATQCVKGNGAGDNSHWLAVHCLNFLNAGTTQQINQWTISGAANNGSGLYRITVAATSDKATAVTSLVAGDTVYLQGMTGAQSANNKFLVASVGPTYVDLAGSATAGVTPTGSTTLASPVVYGLSSVANIGPGDAISGAGVPANATVAALWPDHNALVMSANATATATNVTLSIADTAYVSGGTLTTDAGQRSGEGFLITNSTGTQCDQCFVIAHSIGFHTGAGAYWTKLTGSSFDSNGPATYPGEIGLLVDGDSKGTAISDGWIFETYTPVVVNTTNTADPTIIANMTIDANGGGKGAHYLSLDSGRVLLGMSTGSTGSAIFVADSTGNHLTLGVDDLQHTYAVQDAAAAAAINQDSSAPLAAGGLATGYFALPGAVTLGSAGSLCNALSPPCGVSTNGAGYDLSGSVVTMTNGGTDSGFPGNVTSRWYHSATPGSTLQSYGLAIPPGSTGQHLELHFDSGVTALKLTGAATVGFPGTIAPYSSVRCGYQMSAWQCY